MRLKRDYKAVSVRSIAKDFRYFANQRQKPKPNTPPEPQGIRRVQFVGENSPYYKNRHLIVGKLIRLIAKGYVGGWICEFVHDEDSKALNRANGWSDEKKEYLFDNIKFK